MAARLAPWALCEDTGGSCRLPASASGVLGFRPTLGCYNFGDGLVPASFTRDTVGEVSMKDSTQYIPSLQRSLEAFTAFGICSVSDKLLDCVMIMFYCPLAHLQAQQVAAHVQAAWQDLQKRFS